MRTARRSGVFTDEQEEPMQSGEGRVEALLQELGTRRFHDEADAAAALAELTIEVNWEIDRTLQSGGEPRGPGWERIREIIRKVYEFLKRVANEYGAISYSIGVSLTGLSVSVEWRGPKGQAP
jgi:hypothetical protein